MRSMALGRRMSGEQLVYRDGILMATGAFVFQDAGVWKILTQTQLDHFRALAGDPRTLAVDPSKTVMNYSKASALGGSFVFDEAIFGARLTSPVEQIAADSHPDQLHRVWRHRSDNMAAWARTTDLSITADSGNNFFIDIVLNGVEQRFVFDALNPGAGGVNGDFTKVLDTYFGGAIGLGTAIYIGAARQGYNEVGNVWNGVALTQVGQPPQSFFDSIFGQISGNVINVQARTLFRPHPLCRTGFDELALSGTAVTEMEADFVFPSSRGMEWIAGYVFTDGISGNFWVGSTGANYGLSPSPQQVGMVSKLPFPARLRCQLSGNADVVYRYGPGGYGAPTLTRVGGVFQTANIIAGPKSYYPAFPGVQIAPFFIYKRVNGPYEVWDRDDPALPSSSNPNYEIFTARYKSGNVQRGRRIQATPNGNVSADPESPYPSDGSYYEYGEKVRAAAPAGNSLFVLTIDASGAGRAGMLGATYPSPSGLLQRQPRVAGPFVFLDDDYITINGGQSWVACPHVWGAGTISSGATSLARRFGLSKAQHQAAIPV